jgi:alanyl-tRNA synthetase
VIEAEEKAFLKTLGQGIALFEQMTKGKTEISGDDAFKLHDTFGFPIDLTALMAREKGLSVDEKGFTTRMKEQKARARAAGKFNLDQSDIEGWVRLGDETETNFVGYDTLTASGKLVSFKKDAKRPVLVFDTTPFYAESGGQVADKGVITNGEEYFTVLDVQKQQGKFLHFVDRLPENLDGNWELVVDKSFRTEVAKHHSATHLVHAALRRTLGDHVAQKGSLVDNKQLRFDFSHYTAVTPEELGKIERLVNEKIQENIPLLEERNVPIAEARKRGAMMLFGEKYGENVRIITFDPAYSVELCGGTHVKHTGEIGYFRFMFESSVASGVRRIQAVTGAEAHNVLSSEKHLFETLKKSLGGADPLVELAKLQDEKKALEKRYAELKMHALRGEFDMLAANPKSVNGANVIIGSVRNASMDDLKQLGYDSLNRHPKGTVTVLASADAEAGKVYIVTSVSDDLIASKGWKAGALVGQLAKLVGGGGGGQPNLATAGGKQPEKMAEMLEAVPGLLG